MIYSNNTYDITNDISTYVRRDFSSVYDTSRSKWFMLNNLNSYEEYGIYGTDFSSHYDGKLVEVNGYEYEWDGNDWNNLGATSEYVSSVYRDASHTGTILINNINIDNIKSFALKFRIRSSSGAMFFGAVKADGTAYGDTNDWRIWGVSTMYYDCGSGRHLDTYGGGVLNILFGGDPMKITNLDTSTVIYTKNVAHPSNGYLKFGSNTTDYGYIYDLISYSDNDGQNAVAHYIPYIQNNVVGLYDTINDVFIAATGTVGAEISTNRPKTYTAKTTPTIVSLWASKIYKNSNHIVKLMKNSDEIGKLDYMSGDLLKKGEVITYSDYIHMDLDDYNSNKMAYIDLNYTPTLTTNVEITLKVVNNTFNAGDTYFFGCNNYRVLYQPQNAYGARIRTNTTPNYYFEPSYNNNAKDQAVEIPLNEDFTVRFDQTTVADKFTFYANGNIVSSCTWDLASSLSDRSLFIFACNGTSIEYAHPYEWVKEIKIYEGTTLMRDYIPAEQNNSGGLFETINEVFYGPTGNGKIIYEHIEN